MFAWFKAWIDTPASPAPASPSRPPAFATLRWCCVHSPHLWRCLLLLSTPPRWFQDGDPAVDAIVVVSQENALRHIKGVGCVPPRHVVLTASNFTLNAASILAYIDRCTDKLFTENTYYRCRWWTNCTYLSFHLLALFTNV